MIASFREYRRRAILPFIGLIMAGYYLLVFLPLSQKAKEMDKPLDQAWRKLSVSLGRTNALALDFRQIANQLSDTRQALEVMAEAEKKTVARLQPSAGLRERMQSPFRLVDYQNELSKHSEEVARQAHLREIQIDPAVFDGLPQHRIEITEPALLWGALRCAEDVLDTAVACGVSAIHSLETPVAFTNNAYADPTNRWIEVPVAIEFSGTAAAVTHTLQSLALRADELKPAGLPETSPEKSVLFIDRLIIKRQAPEKTDFVRVWLRAAGYIMRE